MIKRIIGSFILATVISTGAFAQDGVVRMGTDGYCSTTIIITGQRQL
jgi:hypothetical protein